MNIKTPEARQLCTKPEEHRHEHRAQEVSAEGPGDHGGAHGYGQLR